MRGQRLKKLFYVLLCCGLFAAFLSAAVSVSAEQLSNYCSVTFNNNSGTSSSKVYSKLNKVVPRNSIITLPDIVKIDGYENLGWTTAKGKTTPLYEIGSRVKIKGNVRFYLVRKKIPTYKVTFNNNSGTSTSNAYLKLTQNVKAGTIIILPTCGDINGYVTLGWTTTKGGTTPLYEMGKKYAVTGNTNFYIVRQPAYTIQFVDSDGSSNTEFKALKTKVAIGSSMTLPSGPTKEGSTCSGWSTTPNGSVATYVSGTSFVPTKNTKLYAVYSKSLTVTYLSNDGSKIYKKVKVGKGAYLKIAGRVNDEGLTFMGWSASPGQKMDPSYMVGKSIKVTKNLKLYAVQFVNKKEYNYTANTLPQLDTRRYTKLILVGDSRTRRLQQTLEAQFQPSLYKGVSFVAQGGSELTWLKTTGYTKLMEEIGAGGTAAKPIVIVFNSGVNDLLNIHEYISFMQEIEPVLKEKYCKLYYMSVNPLNNAILQTRHAKNRPESRVYNFNSKIQSLLCVDKKYIYLDVFSYLMRNGYTFDSGQGVDIGTVDGVHYSTKTYKRIYAYIINSLNQNR